MAGPVTPGPVMANTATPGPVTPLPSGFGVTLDAATKQLSDGSLFGGSPARVLRLTAAGQQALTELRAGPIRSSAAAVLARRLTDAGMAHPVPPPADPARQLDVTVVIPVRDRAAMLDRCLAAVAARYPVIVVDDGSADESVVAAVAARHGASVRRRASTGGPAAARNSGLAGIGTELVAFLDSDCVPPPGWIAALATHLADPLVAAVAPRIVALAPRTAAGRYEQARGSLDLGRSGGPCRPGEPGRVRADSGPARPPRRTRDCQAPHRGGIRSGAPVRRGRRPGLATARGRAGVSGTSPSVQVPHEGPATWTGLLARRFRYGTSAAPLARRHPANLAPLVLQPWPAVTAGAALARRPAAAAAASGRGLAGHRVGGAPGRRAR